MSNPFKMKGYSYPGKSPNLQKEGHTASGLPANLYTSGGAKVDTVSDIDEGTLSEIKRKGTAFEHVTVTVDDNPGLAKGTKLYTSKQSTTKNQPQ